jgi:hypothetical protein
VHFRAQQFFQQLLLQTFFLRRRGESSAEIMKGKVVFAKHEKNIYWQHMCE